MVRKYKGLGVGGFCLPEKSLADNVTHAEMQAELARLREAVILLASRVQHDLGTKDAQRIMELLAPLYERNDQ